MVFDRAISHKTIDGLFKYVVSTYGDVPLVLPRRLVTIHHPEGSPDEDPEGLPDSIVEVMGYGAV